MIVVDRSVGKENGLEEPSFTTTPSTLSRHFTSIRLKEQELGT